MVARTLSFVVLFAGCFLASAIAEEEAKYSDKYDHLDVDAVLANDRLRTQYYKCMLDTGPCVTQDAIFFKGTLCFLVIFR